MGIFGAAKALFGSGGSESTGPRGKRKQSSGTAERKETILVIDDDSAFLDTMRTMLGGEGYNVLVSRTGPKGLDMMRYAGPDVRAVLLDFNMPRFNGAKTLPFLRQLNPNAKVLAVSGVNASELPADFCEGVDRFISKPFSNDELLKTLEEVLDGNRTAGPSAAATS
jgi:CheY-like chemotaxis protein